MAARSSRLLRDIVRLVTVPKRPHCRQSKPIGIVGAPFGKGQPHVGVAQGPQQLREAGLVQNLESMGCLVQDHGDLQFQQVENDSPSYNVKNPGTIGSAMKLISDSVYQTVKSGQVCLTLGGDHSVALGSVHGHARAEPNMKIIWVDAHADINTPLTSWSGNIHGMVLSFLLQELQEYMPPVRGLEWLKPCITAKDIAYIGLRALDPAEQYIVDKLGVTCFTMHEVDKYGIEYVLQQAISTVNPNLDYPMHLSFDIDSLDPTVSPSTGTPVPGGLTIREGMYIAEELAQTGKLAGIDLVEVNPDLGQGQSDQTLTLSTACQVVAACFGKKRSGYVPANYALPRP